MEKELGAHARDGKRTETAQKSISEIHLKNPSEKSISEKYLMEKELGARVRDGKRTETAQKSISELEAKSGGVLIYNSAQNISLSYFQGVLIYNSAENI